MAVGGWFGAAMLTVTVVSLEIPPLNLSHELSSVRTTPFRGVYRSRPRPD